MGDTQLKREGSGGGCGSGRNWEIGGDTYTLLMLYVKQIINENILQSTGNSTVFCDLSGKDIQEEGLDVYAWPAHFTLQWKLTTS